MAGFRTEMLSQRVYHFAGGSFQYCYQGGPGLLGKYLHQISNKTNSRTCCSLNIIKMREIILKF